MAITFRQLRYFLVLTEELHFGHAAKRLHISQPPLSASLRQLEEELGVQLLERSSKHVALTSAGEAFQRQARRMLEQLTESRTLVRRIAASASGLVRVGFTPAMLFRQLPTALKALQASHPGIDIQLMERNSAEQIAAIEAGQLEIGFIHSIPLPETLSAITIADEPFLCCLPRYHPLSSRDALSISDLVGEPLVMFNRKLAPHYYDRIVSLFHIADQTPSIKHEVSHWLTIVALIAHGMGVALVPQALAGSMFTNVVFLPLADMDVRHQSQCIWLTEASNANRDLLIDSVRTSCRQTFPDMRY
ncbi:LysR family transcriptional regulator [Halomonas urumqiensis]|uniref:LysR family transcriptional regulator n=1 Tax=Halomonas urumqiensis TaxID=1684789 RepID=A0A2N7ULU8_9GAMM|nr:LysR family transcriptional regulator [Halomonas urumqiensis]PMR81404.1 LysR family transcriptional regulator [Halomonas urumqiensis]PTB01204.1 LysR family transcriptional regulator [Halomonas urumqiensis]GHE22781.1 LysR family transcriptional regulator [Halomonas urumqiensis]